MTYSDGKGLIARQFVGNAYPIWLWKVDLPGEIAP
jgi:hypothetical protein